MLEVSPAADGQVNSPTRRAAQPCKGNVGGGDSNKIDFLKAQQHVQRHC
jgi:hypothetical protein